LSANIRETRLCIGKKQQSALLTPLVAADCISILKTNPSLFNVDLKTENDSAWVGKDDEFATQKFLTNWEVGGSIDGFLSSLKGTLIPAFALGKVVESPFSGGGSNYIITPLDPVAEGIAFNSGVGLQNATISSQWWGSGKVVQPSTITIPVRTLERMLPGYSVALTILGDDYVTAKSLQNVLFNWKNNMRPGHFPGSGQVDGAQVQGRAEHGDRTCGLSLEARFANGSTELTKLINQTEGTMVLSATGPLIGGLAYHSIEITLQRVVYSSAVIRDAGGIVTVAITTLPMTHSVNGLVQIETNTDVDDILAAA
jgi:hypothetical protein